jgi:hypothetical protein
MEEMEKARSRSLESSPTAETACEFICKGLTDLEPYRVKPPLLIDPIDRMGLTVVIATSIAAQLHAISSLNMRISE